MAYIPHPKHVPFEYSKITNFIYLGSNQCCVGHFKKKLLAKGIKADISLEKEKLDGPFGVKYFLWLPVIDHKAPTQVQLMMGALAIDNLVGLKVKIYVHCKRGHGRSPTLVAAWLVLNGMSAKEAIAYIRKKRKIHMKMEQILALKRFEKRLS